MESEILHRIFVCVEFDDVNMCFARTQFYAVFKNMLKDKKNRTIVNIGRFHMLLTRWGTTCF